MPDTLIQAEYDSGVTRLAVVSNNCGALDCGLAALLAAGWRGGPRPRVRPARWYGCSSAGTGSAARTTTHSASVMSVP